MPEDAHSRRLSFLFLSVLATASLVLLSFDLAQTNAHSLETDQSTSPADYFHSLTKSARVAGHTFGRITGLTKGIAKEGPFSFAATAAHGAGTFGDTTLRGATAAGRGVSGGVYSVVHTIGRTPHFVATAVDVNTYIKTADYVHVPVITPTPDPPATETIAAATPAPAPVQPIALQAPAPAKPASAPQPAIAAPPLQFDTLNTYAWGNCTWWAAKQRAQIGDPIPNSWGNAATWASRAARDGYAVDHHPSPGAIMQTPYSAGGLGHVAFVESVDQDGTWHISEMNVLGLDVVDHKAESPAAAASYSFIHDRT